MAVAVTPEPDLAETAAAQTIEDLQLSAITPAPDNPRKTLGDVDELAASMRELGLLQPLVVTPRKGKFMVVCGHRRHAAAKKAKLETVPAIVRDLDEPQRIKAMLVENCQRTDLTALEEARAYAQLVELGLTQRQIADDVGKTQGHISKRLSLLRLPKDVLGKVDSGGISIADALELVALVDHPAAMKSALARIKNWSWSATSAVRHELSQIAMDEKREAEIERVKASGVRYLPMPGQYDELPKDTMRVDPTRGWDSLPIKVGAHSKLDCHAATVDRHGTRVYLCTDPKSHPAELKKVSSYYLSGGSSTQSSQQREHRQIQKLRGPRRELAAEIATSRLPKADHAKLLLDTLIASAHSEVLKVACQMLLPDRPAGNGYRDFGDALREYATTPAKQLHVEAAIAFATSEEHLGVYYDWHQHAPYLELLERHGYTLDPLEAKKIGRKATAKAAA